MPPYRLMYRLGLAPWEWRDVPGTWRPLLEGATAQEPGRALDVGCGTGRDAVYLTKQGWRVTGVDFAEEALSKARQRASDEGVEVEWVPGDVGRLGQLGLEPGYSLLYDFGCIQGLPDPARRGAADGLTRLAAPGASLLMFAFKRGRHILLPRGMDRADVVALLGDGWDLQQAQSAADERMPRFVRRAGPTVSRLTRRGTGWLPANRRLRGERAAYGVSAPPTGSARRPALPRHEEDGRLAATSLLVAKRHSVTNQPCHAGHTAGRPDHPRSNIRRRS
jgi:SAM-dependent methyltransferase